MPFLAMVVPVALLTSLTLASSSCADERDANTPQHLITEWAASFNANDPDLLCEFYDQSDNLEVITSSGVRHHGYPILQKAYADDHEVARFYESEPLKISVRDLGDTALVTFEHRFKFRLLEDNTRWQVHVRTTSVLQRIGDEWRIVLEHSSPIHGIERRSLIQE
jgi:ketosteroid isomerase-like protein